LESKGIDIMRTIHMTLYALALLGLLAGTGCYYERIETRDRVEDHRGGPDHYDHHDRGPDHGDDHGDHDGHDHGPGGHDRH
jgi:hypothetical protein